ncbi:hypothetical protein EJ08DRAFT_225338 [Tothia fuscella]|uniref:Beta-hexosaminidase n=1 Tax=Tothia fuscella TaxID=1048955 RepID=A0A9P4P3I2_9PEZI|nr:hypothetical protein EJ08DRAFT_225338 [Tothia fuscella]
MDGQGGEDLRERDRKSRLRTPITPNHYSRPGSYVNDSSNTSRGGTRMIQAAIQRTQQTLFEQGFVPWKFHARNSDFEPKTTGKKSVTSITLTVTGGDESPNVLKPLAGEIDETYSLTISKDGAVEIKAPSTIGIVHGLTTFTQLFYKHSRGGIYTPSAPVSIKDGPKFAHRGINMDVSRNWFETKDIKRMIDAAGYNKMNRFHLHITDSQSWPLEIPALPDLAAKGAYRSDLTYTPGQLADIQMYGALQGVEVYLEIDMPGHTASIWYSNPDLIASYNKQPNWVTFAAEPPSGTLKLNSPKVYDFLNTLLGDLLPRTKPYTAYFHTGGDEVNVNAYLNDDTVNSNDTKVLQPLMQKFVDRNHKQVRDNGMTPIVWEEMLLTWNVTLGKDVLVQTWQSDAAVAATVAAGHKALVGNYNYWYLDCGRGQWLNFRQETAAGFYPFEDYCKPVHNWRVMYAYDPYSGVPQDKHSLVVGGECHIWAEMTDPVNIDRMVWPRAAAAAEVLWSGAKDAQGLNRSQVEAAPRLSQMRERLVAKGVMAEPIQMIYCLQEPNQCNL